VCCWSSHLAAFDPAEVEAAVSLMYWVPFLVDLVCGLVFGRLTLPAATPTSIRLLLAPGSSSHMFCRSTQSTTHLHHAMHQRPCLPPGSWLGAPPSTSGDENPSIFRSSCVCCLEDSVDPIQPLLLCTAFLVFKWISICLPKVILCWPIHISNRILKIQKNYIKHLWSVIAQI
jgi:hypothetical protein